MPKNDFENIYFSLDNNDSNNIPYSQSTSNFYEQSLTK